MTKASRIMPVIAALGLLASSWANVVVAAPLQLTKLPLMNGWVAHGPDTRYPTVGMDSNNIVHLRGAMRREAGTSTHPFTLPLQYRPNRDVLISVDLSNGQKGRLVILNTGPVYVQALQGIGFAETFTSLEGVTYVKN